MSVTLLFSAVPLRAAAPPSTAVLSLAVVPAARAAVVLHAFFPKARLAVDRHANAVIVSASAEDIAQMRAIVQGIDVRDPQRALADVVPLHVVTAQSVLGQLQALFPQAKIQSRGSRALLVRANSADMTELKTLIAALDVAPTTPAPSPRPEDTIRISQAEPKNVARALVRAVPDLHANVSGSTIILTGTDESVQKAKTLAQSLDVPPYGSKFTQIYRLHSVDAASVGDLIAHSFPNDKVVADQKINAVSVYASGPDQQRIATSIDQIDAVQSGGAGCTPAFGDGNVDVVQLNSAIPGQNGAPSTTASDIAQAVQQSLATLAPELRLTPLNEKAQIILAGNPQSIRLGRDLIERLDVPEPLVAMDTQVLEVNETVARNLGFEVPGAYVSTTFSEISPSPNPLTGAPGAIGGFQSLTRTPITFQAVLNFLIQKGDGRVLADPRLTTVSGRTANITAGDTINVLTQTGGGITPITQQLQSFPTGVSLDITPIVNRDGTVTVSVHPRVSSVVPGSAANTVPDIAQREATTVVKLRNDETLVIGGLIQETNSRQVTKIPLLGDLPLIGRLFQNYNVSSSRNELIIAITPHVIQPGEPQPLPSALPPVVFKPQQLQPPRPQPQPTKVPTPTPEPTPTAFAQTNVFTYGSPPPSTFAADSDAPRVYFVQFSPTVLVNGAMAHVYVVTSSNVKRVTFGYPGRELQLAQIAPAKWQADYTFNSFGMPLNSTIDFAVNAYGAIGAAATIQVPVSILR